MYLSSACNRTGVHVGHNVYSQVRSIDSQEPFMRPLISVKWHMTNRRLFGDRTQTTVELYQF
jgi:hypothetical protein